MNIHIKVNCLLILYRMSNNVGKEVVMMKDLLIEIIEEIQKEADEILQEKQTDYEYGQLLAYATSLGIIKTCLASENLKDFGLDYDIDKKYLL